MIVRSVEYIRYCDVDGCNNAEAEHWQTRSEAEFAATRDGWLRCSNGKWMCPDCKQKTARKEVASA